MKCSTEAANLMHKYLDDEISKDQENLLKQHLHDCESCQRHFHELKRTITLVQSTSHLSLPNNFTEKVMANLPKEKKSVGYKRWLKAHPMLAAAAIFFLMMLGSVSTIWNQHDQLTVSKQDGIIIHDNTVIVPEGKIIEGDLVVKNGNLKIEGQVKGNVILINGGFTDGSNFLASAGQVTGEIEEVNQIFDWIWYHIKKTTKSIFTLGNQVSFNK